MKKKVLSVIIIWCMFFSMIQHNVLAYTDVKITYNGQVVDSFAGVDAIYATLNSYNNVDTNTTYSCAAFLKKFCSTLWGVTIYNINTVNAAPSVSKSGHSVYLKTVSSPRPGDIMQTKTYGHVAVVKAVSGSNAILIEQNWSYNSGGYRYARKERSVPISSVYFYRIVIDGVEAEVPGTHVHSYARGIEKSHAHREYMKCRCGDSYYTGNYGYLETCSECTENHVCTFDTFLFYGSSHPHWKWYECRCGETLGKDDFGYLDTCYECVNAPGKPALKNMKSAYEENETIVFEWDTTENTTHYNLTIYKKTESGELAYVERINYATSGVTRKYDVGEYCAKLESKNSKHWNSAGTDWLSTFSNDYYFEVVATLNVTFNANGGVLSATPKAETYADGVNVERGVDKLIVFNAGSTTGTNKYGYEVVVDSNHKVIETTSYVGNASIPSGGFVLSGCGTQSMWLDANVKVDDYVIFDETTKKITIYSPEAWFATNKSVFNGDTYGYLPTPTREGYEFKGWFEDNEYRQEITSDSVVTATEDITLYAKWERINDITLSTVNGAQIRTTGAQGLRFISSIDKTSLDFSRVVEYGTILIPSADIADISELEIGATLNGHTVAKVKANYIYDETDDAVTFTAVITNVAAKNYAREYTARAYAIMDDGSVVYADAGASRSIYAVAKRGLENPNESDANKGIFQGIVDSVEGGV